MNIKYTIPVLCIAMTGCVSLPNNMPELPEVQGFAVIPNCILNCHIIVNIGKSTADIQSSGTGAVTAGAQSTTQSGAITTTDTTTKEVNPKP